MHACDLPSQPLTLLNTPMGLSGDVLRRTFSTRLTEMTDRAAAASYRSPQRETL